MPVEHDPPVDRLDDDFPIRLTTGRRLDSYNTGVQSGGYTYPRRRGETLDLSPEDLARLGLAEGERVRVVSRRGAVEAPVRVDEGLRPGLAFMTLHFQDDVTTNNLTIDATDPKSGTAEFKATAIRIEKLGPNRRRADRPVRGPRRSATRRRRSSPRRAQAWTGRGAADASSRVGGRPDRPLRRSAAAAHLGFGAQSGRSRGSSGPLRHEPGT